MRRFLLLFSLCVLALLHALPLQAQVEDSLLEVVSQDRNLSILAAALGSADPAIAQTLDGDGQLTLFAPSNAAFAAFLRSADLTQEELLSDRETLTQVLLYHVLVGRFMAEDVKTLAGESGLVFPQTLQGSPLTLTVDKGIFANTAKVIQADEEASNGVLHIVNRVLVPPANLAEQLEAAGKGETFSILAAAVEAGGLQEILASPDARLTVFAPTDEAFAEALEELGLEAADLLADIPTLQSILSYHVVPERLFSTDLKKRLEENEGALTLPSALPEARLSITSTERGLFVDGVQVVVSDVVASNGVLHILDGVLLPNAKAE
jgi:uncharacterized surface protein with fasciclin (FAS1) repeats